jgi:hypothetical protein
MHHAGQLPAQPPILQGPGGSTLVYPGPHLSPQALQPLVPTARGPPVFS